MAFARDETSLPEKAAIIATNSIQVHRPLSTVYFDDESVYGDRQRRFFRKCHQNTSRLEEVIIIQADPPETCSHQTLN